MDPNGTLKQLRELLGGDHSAYEVKGDCIEHTNGSAPSYQPEVEDTEDLLMNLCKAEELFQALDEWIINGGNPLDAWRTT